MEDLTGMIFGSWTVESIDDSHSFKARGQRWNCTCVCGKSKSVLGKYLKNGKSTSCGCSKKKNLTGQRFGKLVVVETIYNYNNSKRASYRCLCDCENEILVKSCDIYKRTSCGCGRFQDLVGTKYGKLTITEMLYNYKGNNITYCKCSCDCGTVDHITKLESLKSGNTTSCGCNHSPSLIGQTFGLLTVLEEVVSDTNQREWLCKCQCGNTVVRTSHHLKTFYSCGCLQNKSLLEECVKNILCNFNVTYIPQKRFDDCRDTYPLPFDLYLPKHNICIECDGIQHFEPVEHFGGEENFLIRQKHDNIKTNYCLNNDIILIRIPHYMSEDEITQTLHNNIIVFENPVTTTVV